MNPFGLFLFLLICFGIFYLAFFIFFETKLDGYLRIIWSLIILAGLIYFIINYMYMIWQ